MTIKQAAFRAAQQFKAGRGRAWAWCSDHDAIVDAECMDQVRAAHYSGGSFSLEQIMEFRSAFVTALEKAGFWL